jgi:hypothetical protein
MNDFRVVYLIVERNDPEQPNLWRVAGSAFVCRDGSLNLKLDLFPGLRFNIREPKSNGERADAGEPQPNGKQTPTGEPLPEVSTEAQAVPRRIPKKVIKDDDIPF